MKKIKKLNFGGYNSIVTLDFNVNKDSNFLFISYWWGKGNINKNSRKNLTYDQLTNRLIDDCYKTKCNYCFVEIPDFAVPGGYQKAINFKPTFILDFVKNHLPKNIENAVYIDTDMSILKHPYLFEMSGYDFMGYNWNWEPRQMYGQFPSDCYDPYTLHTSGGLLMFTKSKPSITLLEAWDSFVQKYPGKAEDRMLSIPFNDDMMVSKLRCFWLPNEYFWLPYFFEYDDEFQVEKQYQKSFKKFGIKFEDDITEEMSFKKFYNTKMKDIVIIHPEMLTSEEMASKQGADLNRVPLEWFKSQGRKKRCLTDDNELIINEKIFTENAKQRRQIKYALDWLEASHFIKLSNKNLEIRSQKLSIFKKDLSNDSSFIYLTKLEGEDNDIIKDWIKMVKGNDYIILNKNKNNLARDIFVTMKKYKKDIIYLNLNCRFTDDLKELKFEECDFACLNSNAYPYYTPSLKEKCKDDRILDCVTTDILCFRNNRFGKNILKVWNSESNKKIPEAQSLSIAFNRYEMILPTRCKWFDPGMAYNKKFVTQKKGYPIRITTINDYPKFIKKYSIFDYLKQCGEKRPVSIAEGAYKTHYTGSKYKKIKID